MREAGFGDMAEGTVYPALARLEQAKRLDSYLVPSEKGPARKYYRLTPAGALELERALDAWNHLTGLVAGMTQGENS